MASKRLMMSVQLVDEGSADGHTLLSGETSIEGLFDCPASTGFSHEGLEADNFASHPGRLGPGAKRNPYRFMELSIAAQPVAGDGLSETYEVEEQGKEKRKHAERLCCRGLVGECEAA